MSLVKFSLFLALIGFSFGILPSNYENLPASDKLDILWSQISREPYSDNLLPKSNPSFFSMLSLFFPAFLKKSFLRISDEMPPGRQKLIHTHGSVAAVELRITSNSSRFTGIFRSGGIGISRLSLARQNDDNFIPGMALKILIDHRPSVNFHVLNSLEGQGMNKNFFAKNFKNVLPEPSTWSQIFLSKTFAFAVWLLPGLTEDRPESVTNLPVYELAAVESNGKVISQVYAPYLVNFIPNPDLGWPADTKDDFRVNLKRVPAGSLLYTVSVKRDLASNEEIIGEVLTTSPFVSSRYADESLFFQHAKKRWRP